MIDSSRAPFLIRCSACGQVQDDRAERCPECGLSRSEQLTATIILSQRRASRVLALMLIMLLPLPFALVLSLRLGAFTTLQQLSMWQVMQTWWVWAIVASALPACVAGVVISWLPSTRMRKRPEPPPEPIER